MKKALLSLFIGLSSLLTFSQTTWQVCVEDPPSTTCTGKTGTFTPGNLVIQQGDMIQFTTTMVLLGGYTGTYHDIQFTGSPANNVMLLVSSDIFNQTTTVTTPPFNTPGIFPMECTNFNHCILSEYSCTGYTVEVQATCGVTASFTASNTTVCTGDIVNFTNTSTGASGYEWHLDEFTYATSTNSVLSFSSAGSYDIELIADDGTCADSMTITINVDPESDAGDDNSQSLCNIDDSLDLNTLLNGDTGGFWEETTSSGAFNSSSAVLSYDGLSPQDYYFDYIVSGVGVCPNDTATMMITMNQQPSLTLNVGATPIANYDSVYVDFTTSGVLPGAQYLWDFCDGNLQTDTLPFYYSWGVDGNFCVCVQVNNGNGCLETFCDSTIVVFDASQVGELLVGNLGVFPNPANGLFTIDLTKNHGPFDLKLLDLKGSIVYRENVQGGLNVVLDSKQFEAGTYIISLSSQDYLGKATVVFE